MLEKAFGDENQISVISDALPNVTRTFTSLSQVVAEIADARVFAGIHFRQSCVRGNALGRHVAAYVSTHAFRSDHGEDDDDR